MGPPAGRETQASIRYLLSAVFVLGIRRRNPGAVVNAALAFLGTYLPAVVERTYGVELRPWQRAYVGMAMLTHATGMLGPYDDVWWWDHLTHTLSASVVGGLAFTISRRNGRDPRPRVIIAVFGLGLLWEVIEYVVHASVRRLGLEPILVFYSRTDTLFDLLFNLLGAVIVLVFGDHALGNLLRSEE